MTEKPNAALLDRIEEGARGAWPVWEWLLFLWLVGLPILLGYAYAAMAEDAAGGQLAWEDYQTILYVKGGGTAAMFIAAVVAANRGWHRKLMGWPDPSRIVPGPFRLGSALIEIYSRPWMGVVLMSSGLSVLISLVDTGEADSVPEIFWMSRALFGWFFGAAVVLIGVISLAGLFVQLRLRERGERP